MLLAVLYSIAACATFLKEAHSFTRRGGNDDNGSYDIEDCLMDLSFALVWPITWIRWSINEIYVRKGWWT